MTPKNQIHLSLIIFIVTFLLLFVFLIYPLFSEIKQKSQTLISQRKSMASLGKKTENLRSFEIQYQEIKPNLEKISNLFVESEAPVEFITFLEKEAQNCGASLEISSAMPLQIKVDPWPSLSFQIISAGSFPQISRFVEKLESSPHLLEIQSLNIKRLDERELLQKEFEGYSVGDVKINLSFKIFSN